MKKHVRIFSVSLCVILLSSSLPVQATKPTSDFWSDVATGCAYAGAALLGVGGAIGLGVKMFSDEPHHKLLARAQDAVSSATREFQPLIAIVIGLNNVGYTDGDDVYRIGDFLIQHGATVERCLSATRQAERRLTDLSNELRKRILILQGEPSTYNNDLRFSMVRVKQELDAILSNVAFTDSYIRAREHYLAFHEVAKKLYEHYRSIIDTYYKYGVGYAFEQELKDAVMREAAHTYDGYPYMDFYMRIDGHTKRLNSVLRRISGTASIHLTRGNDLLRVLDIVKNTVYSSPAYAHEYSIYQQRKVEKAHVDATNSQIAREKNRVAEMEKQVRIDQRRIEEMERSNYARARNLAGQQVVASSAPISATVHFGL